MPKTKVYIFVSTISTNVYSSRYELVIIISIVRYKLRKRLGKDLIFALFLTCQHSCIDAFKEGIILDE